MSGVVVGVDDSETARRAIKRAASMADAMGEPLHLVMGVRPGTSRTVTHGTDVFVDDWLSSARQELESIKTRAGVPHATTSIGDRDPASAICGEADCRDASLIVVGNRRVQGAARLLGSVATDVLRQARCDVLVAHTTHAAHHEITRPELTFAPIFRSCDAEQTQRLDALTTPIEISAGTELTTQGTVGREFGVLLDGTATVTVDGRFVAALGAGDHFGEIALLADVGDDDTRNATVTADCDMRIAVMSIPEFHTLIRSFPEVAGELHRTALEHLDVQAA